jgi:hypothetical protein
MPQESQVCFINFNIYLRLSRRLRLNCERDARVPGCIAAAAMVRSSLPSGRTMVQIFSAARLVIFSQEFGHNYEHTFKNQIYSLRIITPLRGWGYFKRISTWLSIIKLIGFTERIFYVKYPR